MAPSLQTRKATADKSPTTTVIASDEKERGNLYNLQKDQTAFFPTLKNYLGTSGILIESRSLLSVSALSERSAENILGLLGL